MASTNPTPSIHSAGDSNQDPVESSTTIHSLSRAVHARKAEYVRPHRIRIKVGTWNVAACPGTDKDLASWFIDGRGLEPQFDSNLARMHLSEDSVITTDETRQDGDGNQNQGQNEDKQENKGSDTDTVMGSTTDNDTDKIHLVGGDKIGLYVLGLQEMVNLNLVHQSFYSDPNTVTKWKDALEAALPRGYQLVASEQLVGLLLLIYASPEVASTISNESSTSVGTGVLGYMGNKGAVSSRILLGETTRLAFVNTHLASGQDQTSLDRRCWDYNKILTQTKFNPISIAGITEDEEEKLGDEDFAFFFGDLNFRLDGLPGDDIRRLLTLHARGEYDIGKKDNLKGLGADDGVIVLQDNDDEMDGFRTPQMISRETSFNSGEDDELPDPDDFMPDPHDDPASLQATLDSLLPHDQLRRMIQQRKAFHEGWKEGTITFLPTYKYDVGTVGLFDSSEKKRAPSWCDRILYRTRKGVQEYEQMCKDEIEAKKKDAEMKKSGLEQAAADESVLFDYDPSADSSGENLASGDSGYEYDEYDETAEDNAEDVITKEGFVDKIDLDIYTSHQRIMSSDHKPLAAMFTLHYDAVVPELKAKIHSEVAWELDRAENEGRPVITVIVDAGDPANDRGGDTDDASGGIDFGEVAFLRPKRRSLTVANTGRVPAQLLFVEKPGPSDENPEAPDWLHHRFVRDGEESNEENEEKAESEMTLDPGDTMNVIIEVEIHNLAHVRALNEESARLEDVLVLRVTDGRDHFIPVRASWQPSCFGRSLEELIRVPRGGIRALIQERQKGGSIPYSLDVQNSSPTEIFKLTEALESLTERIVADENMLDDCKVPRHVPGWPFDEASWQAAADDDRANHKAAIVEALEEGRPVLDAIHSGIPTVERLEIVGEVLLLFLRSMTDGVISAPLWIKIEQAIPALANSKATLPPEELEAEKTAILDILASAPYNNISFVFLMSMLTKVANDIQPLSKDDDEALSSRSRKPKTGPLAAAGQTLGFRRATVGQSGNAGASVNEAAIQRRLAWEKRTAEIFGVAICRAGGDPGLVPINTKEKKARDDKMRGAVEVFLRRREGP